jgi:hypothetical protein
MFIRHQVGDFAQWKQVYDGLRDTQKRLGVTAEAVYRAPTDRNDVTVSHDFANLDRARAFVESDELRGAMQNAGVVGEPTLWFADRV